MTGQQSWLKNDHSRRRNQKRVAESGEAQQDPKKNEERLKQWEGGEEEEEEEEEEIKIVEVKQRCGAAEGCCFFTWSFQSGR